MSTGSPDSWNWNFGDKVTSTKQNPKHIYETAGVYTVKETVTNKAGENIETKPQYITVMPSGNADTVLDNTGTGSDTGTASDKGTGSDIGTASDKGTGSDTGTASDKGTNSDTGTASGKGTNSDTGTDTGHSDTSSNTSSDPGTAIASYPTKSEVLTFVNKYQGRSDFIETVSEASRSDHLEWKWDIWRDQSGNKFISFYHYENNPNGYKAIYFDSRGIENSNPKTVPPPIESHKGA
jgi:PKD repeat protein